MLKLRSWLYSVYLSLPPLLSQLSALLLFLFFSLFIVYMFYSSLQKSFYIYAIGINILLLILLLWEKYQEYVNEAYEELDVERDVNKESIWYSLRNKGAKYSYDTGYKISQIYIGIIYPRWYDAYHKFLIACFIRFNNLSDRVKLIYFYGILIIPKVIVASIFIWDVFIQNELNLFYKVLGLLLLPLLFRFICYNYWIIIGNAMDHIWEEMENDPHRFKGTQEDVENIVANLNKASNNSEAQEYVEQEKDPWYKKIFLAYRRFFRISKIKTERHSIPIILESM